MAAHSAVKGEAGAATKAAAEAGMQIDLTTIRARLDNRVNPVGEPGVIEIQGVSCGQNQFSEAAEGNEAAGKAANESREACAEKTC